MTKETIAAFNKLFEEHGASECSNCESEAEVLRGVEFVLQSHKNLYEQLKAVRLVVEK